MAIEGLGANKEGWEEITEKYIKGLSEFADVSRELDSGVSFSKGDVPKALERLRNEVKFEDVLAIRKMLDAMQSD